MSVYESATKLAEDIKKSEEYKKFQKSMKEIKKDKKSESILKEYKYYQLKLQRSQVKNNSYEENINSIQKQVRKNKKVYNYLENEQNFMKMMNNINAILSEAVNKDYE